MNNIPVLYYHSVANHCEKRKWSFLSCPIEVFKKQMIILKKSGYYFCNWEELFLHINGLEDLGPKAVMVQFDDGFLDNWSIVFPFMQKNNLKFSVLLTTDFIDKSNVERPFVKQTLKSNINDWWGYLNEAEIKTMSSSGIVDFQSHAKSHSWYTSSPNLIDISDKNNLYPHIIWNKELGKKPYWLREKFFFMKGYPIFDFKKSLELDKVFTIKEKYINQLINLYNDKLSKKENLSIYKREIEKILEKDDLGIYETKEEAAKRIKSELEYPKNKIESLTNKPCDYLVFPGGGNNPYVLNQAKNLGFKLVSKGSLPNAFDSNNYQILRFAGFKQFRFFNMTMNSLLTQAQLVRSKDIKFVNSTLNLVKKFF